jgi:uracil phosphoribosyltransferase
MSLVIVDHSLVADRIAVLRDRSTDRRAFRAALSDLAAMLIYEAAREFPTADRTVQTPLAPAPARVIETQPCLVPITRAGLGMLAPALRLFPDADVAFAGMKKDENTFQPVPYLNTIPTDLAGRQAFVLEPMVATGRSAALACRYIAAAGAARTIVITAIAATEGVDFVRSAPGSPSIVAGAVDQELNDIAFIVPGLGDAGDRQFGDYHHGTLAGPW